MDLPAAIRAVVERHDLAESDMEAVMRAIMTGAATPAQIGGFLVGLRMKGETVAEITAAARVMRSLAAQVPATPDHLVDTCGTGGDGAGAFNISTAAAFVAAAAGARVAKHGNRSVSSKSGSADVLEAAGVNLELTPEQVGRCIEQVGVGFLFAPKHHAAMKHAIGPRREMGVRTIFNVLGPLTNPAGAPNQVLGVYDPKLVRPLAEVLQRLGSRHVLVVHADDGLDEISVQTQTSVCELKDGTIRDYRLAPEDFGFARSALNGLRVNDANESLTRVRAVLANDAGPARDIVVLNAGAALYASGVAASLKDGVERALAAISNGAARAKLDALVAFSQACK